MIEFDASFLLELVDTFHSFKKDVSVIKEKADVVVR